MKVLNLRCANGHVFEGWFASDDDFMRQSGGHLVACPLCADTLVSRLPAAPRLNLTGGRSPEAAAPAQQPAGPADLQAAWLAGVRHLMANTEDVGGRFAEEARRIHYGEAEQRGIRGQASGREREALKEEGIETLTVPVPPMLRGPLQ